MGVLRAVRAGAREVLKGVGRRVVATLSGEEKHAPLERPAFLETPEVALPGGSRPHPAFVPQDPSERVSSSTTSPRAPLLTLPELQAACQASSRPLIVHHWATWCEPCEEELPLIQQLYEAVEGHADLLAISWDLLDARGTPEAVAAEVATFLAGRGCTFPVCVFIGDAEALFEGVSLSFHQIPQTQVVGRGGSVMLRQDGPLTRASVAQWRTVLVEDPPHPIIISPVEGRDNKREAIGED